MPEMPSDELPVIDFSRLLPNGMTVFQLGPRHHICVIENDDPDTGEKGKQYLKMGSIFDPLTERQRRGIHTIIRGGRILGAPELWVPSSIDVLATPDSLSFGVRFVPHFVSGKEVPNA